MRKEDALDTFAALSHETRLAVFRLLVHAGPEGMPALQIAQHLGVKPSTLSAHLALLKRAGLLGATRRHKEILYAARPDRIDALVVFLLADCCGGDPAACENLLSHRSPPAQAPQPAIHGL